MSTENLMAGSNSQVPKSKTSQKSQSPSLSRIFTRGRKENKAMRQNQFLGTDIDNDGEPFIENLSYNQSSALVSDVDNMASPRESMISMATDSNTISQSDLYNLQ